MSALRVAHVGTYSKDSADGTEKTVAGLVTWLPRCGVEVEVWQPVRGAERVREHATDDGARIWDVPAYLAPTNFARGVPPATVEFVLERQTQVDVVHLHSGFVPEHVAIAEHVRRPYVVAPNGIYNAANLRGRNWWFKQAWLRWRERPYVRRAALIHAVSEGERDELRSQFPGVPLTLVHNAFDVPSMPTLTPADSDGTRQLLFLGRLAVEQKGLDLLLRGYRVFLDRTADSLTRVALVGPDYRGGLAELYKLVRQLRLEDRVELQAPVYGAAKWALLAGAFAVVHTSRWDGLPFTLLEAMAASRPLLVTPATNVGELVTSYAAGVVVQADPLDVARGLAILSGLSAGQHSTMGRAGQRLVAERFTWPEAARRMADAYRAL
jgi:glycosyltransferase involved in cell wall biosynthesis